MDVEANAFWQAVELFEVIPSIQNKITSTPGLPFSLVNFPLNNEVYKMDH